MRAAGSTFCGFIALVVVASAAFGAPARRAAPLLPERELTVLNRARQAGTELYVSPNDAADWGDDRLAGGRIEPDRSLRVKLGRPRTCLFDAQIVYADGSHEELHGLDICRIRQAAFDGSMATEVPAGPVRQIVLVNNGTRPIQQVFLSEAEAAQWGEDRVATRGVSVGGRLEFGYQGGCAVDLRVIFDNRAAEERRGLDICATPRLSIEPGWTTADAPPVPEQPAALPVAPSSVAPPLASAPRGPEPPAARPEAVTGEVTLRVVNTTGADVTELYFYPEERADQGRDLLGRAVLRDGDAKQVTLARGGTCRFAAHLVFAAHLPDREIHALDLCASQVVTLGR